MVPSPLTQESFPSREELWCLHRAAVDDRRMQMKQSWDRTTYFFLINIGAFCIGNTMNFSPAGRGAFFMFIALNSLFASWAIRKGFAYYAMSRKFLRAIEMKLGVEEDTPAIIPEIESRKPSLPFAERAMVFLQVFVAFAASYACLRTYRGH